jgi:hypothetical protein
MKNLSVGGKEGEDCGFHRQSRISGLPRKTTKAALEGGS